jgi:hypothetical protein
MESADRYWLDELTAVPETAAILDELGVADSPAMKELDAEDCARLTAQMKKVPAKRFQRYLQAPPLEMIQEPAPMATSRPGISSVCTQVSHFVCCSSCPRGCSAAAHREGFQYE